jgi:thioesterase domain-containing protein
MSSAGLPNIRLLAPGAASAPALVFVHPSSGDSADYAPLVARMSWPGAILGIDAAGLRGDGPPPSSPSIAGYATSYLACLRESGAGAPGFLLGWLVGGVIAAEMSQQLVDAGESVAFLGLFDSPAPKPHMQSRPTDELTLARIFAGVTARFSSREIREPPADASPAAVLRSLRDAGAAPPEWSEDDVGRRLVMFAGLARALFSHEQRQVSTRVHLFEAESEHPQHPRPPTLGWEHHAADVVHVPIPGNHFTLMAEEHAARLAGLVDRYLAEAR